METPLIKPPYGLDSRIPQNPLRVLSTIAMPSAEDQTAMPKDQLPELTPPEFRQYNRLADHMNSYVRTPVFELSPRGRHQGRVDSQSLMIRTGVSWRFLPQYPQVVACTNLSGINSTTVSAITGTNSTRPAKMMNDQNIFPYVNFYP